MATALAVAALGVTDGTALAQGLEDPSDQWLPRSDGAEWTYAWSNSGYSPAAKTERYRLQARVGTTFRLRWDQIGAPSTESPAAGTMDFQHTDAGLVNLNYQSTPPPPQYPILCAAASECGNSMAGALYLLIWGTRSPTLAEPLLRGTRWGAQGGAGNDVASNNRYAGRERVTVPAFPAGSRRRRSSRRSRRRARSAIRSAAACARCGGCAASDRSGSSSATPAAS